MLHDDIWNAWYISHVTEVTGKNILANGMFSLKARDAIFTSPRGRYIGLGGNKSVYFRIKEVIQNDFDLWNGR